MFRECRQITFITLHILSVNKAKPHVLNKQYQVLFLLVFTLADIIFHKCLELHKTLKKKFVTDLCQRFFVKLLILAS